MRPFASLYGPRFAVAVTYMLQNTEYHAGAYLRWFWRTHDFGRVMYRRELERTRAAKLLAACLGLGMTLQAAAGLALIVLWFWQHQPAAWQFGLALLVSYPIVWAHLVVIPMTLGRWLVINPRQRKAIRQSAKIFASHPGMRIAVAGSYGKTSMKELLAAVLGAGMKVAASPANRNVAISHAAFARSLDGDEQAVIIEYGEGAPGDVTRFAHQTQPTHGVVTGVAAAHLDRYKTVQAAARDIFSLALAVPEGQLYANADSDEAKAYIAKPIHAYDHRGALGWRVGDVAVSIEGISFSLAKAHHTHQFTSGLMGRHQLGPLAFVAAFAMEQGMSAKKVAGAMAATKPYEHRMQPYQQHGAWIIDDTYNGNIEGIKAGTDLLAELPAARKWYVSPGLVDQGGDARDVHLRMGELIGKAKPDIVVLMRNSVEQYIQAGLRAAEFAGEVRVEDDPLAFYTNLPHLVAAGDLVLMQNDWTDNYA